MTENREFPTAAIASLATGVMLCEFDKMHEAAEFLMGHPIWTHQFADRELAKRMREAILRQCPAMPISLPTANTVNWREKLAEIEAMVGKTVTIAKGDGSTAKHPLDGIPENKEVVVISVDKPAEMG